MEDITIRIPVFKTQTEQEEIKFNLISREDMADSACSKINEYKCSSTKKITITNDFKHFTHEVVSINATKEYLNDSPIVFLQMSAHKTNMRDGYIESPEIKNAKIPVTQNVKIGSEHYYVIMYPMVQKKGNYFSRFWYLFLYDDPEKNTLDFIRIVKKVIKEVLNTKTSHLKPKEFEDEIKVFSGYSMKACFQSIETLSDDIYDKRFSNQFVSGQTNSKTYIEYKDLSYEDLQEIINNDSDLTIEKKIFHIFSAKKSYKVSKTRRKEVLKAKDEYKLHIESNYNYCTNISEDEFNSNKMYDKTFILEKMEPVIVNCLS